MDADIVTSPVEQIIDFINSNEHATDICRHISTLLLKKHQIEKFKVLVQEPKFTNNLYDLDFMMDLFKQGDIIIARWLIHDCPYLSNFIKNNANELYTRINNAIYQASPSDKITINPNKYRIVATELLTLQLEDYKHCVESSNVGDRILLWRATFSKTINESNQPIQLEFGNRKRPRFL